MRQLTTKFVPRLYLREDCANHYQALHDTFAAFGNVLSCKVATDEQGRSRGYGYVHYETAEAAETAIKAVNGMLLNDKKVYVGHHISRKVSHYDPGLCHSSSHFGIKERQSKLEEMRSQFTNLYVKNIDAEVTQDEFVELFENYGTVTSAVILFDDEGRSKGFGFVNFESHDQAQVAVDSLHDSEYKGRKLFVSRAQKKAEREDELRKTYEAAKQEKMSKYQGVNLYIKNLEDDIDDEKLRAEFEPFGTITSCKVMCDEKGTSKGFGFVCFSSPDEATKAVTDMNNKIIGTKPLYVSLAQRREVRRQQLESQIAQRNQIRLQQAAAAGLSGGYINGPMYYPPGPGAYPPQGGRGMMGYGQPGTLIYLKLEAAVLICTQVCPSLLHTVKHLRKDMVICLDTRVEHLVPPFLAKVPLLTNLAFHVRLEHLLRTALLFLAPALREALHLPAGFLVLHRLLADLHKVTRVIHLSLATDPRRLRLALSLLLWALVPYPWTPLSYPVHLRWSKSRCSAR
jgi:RNA recognition motif-containing protein